MNPRLVTDLPASSLRKTVASPLSALRSPEDERDDARANMLKAMRLPLQHYWNLYYDRLQLRKERQKIHHHSSHTNTTRNKPQDAQEPAIEQSTPSPIQSSVQQQQQQQQQQQEASTLELLNIEIASVPDFWRYHNHTPIEKLRLRESLYLFKKGFRPVWEDRRNVLGGCWSFRLSKTDPAADIAQAWTNIQLLAIGEGLQGALAEGDQLCGVGISSRFHAFVISIWHRDASKQASVDAIRDLALTVLPDYIPSKNALYYKRHADNPGFNPSPELRRLIESQKKNKTADGQTGAQATPLSAVEEVASPNDNKA